MSKQVESATPVAPEEWIAERTRQATAMLSECVDADPQRRAGVPVLKGTRFPVAQVLAQIADGDSVDDLVEEFGLDREMLTRFLHGLSLLLDRPSSE